MLAQLDESKENKNRPVSKSAVKKKKVCQQAIGFMINQSEAIAQRKKLTNRTIQRVSYRKAPWINANQYVNTGGYLEQIEGKDWMNVQALLEVPHIQEAEVDAARTGQGPAVTMISTGGTWKSYANNNWVVAVDPTKSVLTMSVNAPWVGNLMNTLDGKWGGRNAPHDDIMHLSTHGIAGILPTHRHSVLPPGQTFTNANMRTLAWWLGVKKGLDVKGGFDWATATADQKAAEATSWGITLATALL